MIPRVTFPKHTQDRMAAAKATKEQGKPKQPGNEKPGLSVEAPALPGVVVGLSVAARQTILKSDTKVTIGYGTIEVFVPMIKDVKLRMLEYYIPNIVAEYKYDTAMGTIILLPDDMNLVTARGITYVVTNMKRELEQGSYATSHFTKDKNDQATCMVRPCHNPVDMIHGLNTLRTFGFSKDADFLAMPNGPIMTSLERRAKQWNGTVWTLRKFLVLVSRDLLADQDHDLMAPAWAVCRERLQAEGQPKTSARRA